MSENLKKEQRIEEPIQVFAGVPGVPGETPKYLEEYPTETDVDSTIYDNKNAIWNNRLHRIVSFAGNDTGLQFKADTYGSSAPIGAPGNPDSTNVYLRVKRAERPYDPWYEIYHRGNLDISKYATLTDLDNKADISFVDWRLTYKADYLPFDEWINSSKLKLNQKEEKENFNQMIIDKATKSWADEALKKKAEIDYVEDGFSSFTNQFISINTRLSAIDQILSSK